MLYNVRNARASLLNIVVAPTERTILRTIPSREAIVSWNTRAAHGSIELAVYRSDGQVSSWLPYAIFSAHERRSLNGYDEVAKIATDIIRAPLEITAIEIRSDAPLDAVAVSTPRYPARSTPAPQPQLLNVPTKSQYLPDQAEERAWCSPAALSMLLAYWGIDLDIPQVVARTQDNTYGGTGNWAFNVALAGQLGLRGVVAHLRDLAHAARFIEAGIPIAVSFAWKSTELPGAPIDHSDGHLAVLRGFSQRRDPILNDPAQPAVKMMYNHVAFERAWRTHGSIAYLVAPTHRTEDLLRLTNS